MARGKLYDSCSKCGLGYEGYDETDATARHDEDQDHAMAPWTNGVQVEIVTVTGEPILDAEQARGVMQDLIAIPHYGPWMVEDSGDGVWLVSLPTATWDEIQEDEGARWTHSSGVVVTIETV